jgi:hypothetical protein
MKPVTTVPTLMAATVDGFNDEDIVGECSDKKALLTRESGGRQWEDRGQQRAIVLCRATFSM